MNEGTIPQSGRYLNLSCYTQNDQRQTRQAWLGSTSLLNNTIVIISVVKYA